MEELTIQDYHAFAYVLTPDTTACYRFGMPLGEQYMEKQDEISYGMPDIQTFICATQYFQNQKAARENVAREDVLWRMLLGGMLIGRGCCWGCC